MASVLRKFRNTFCLRIGFQRGTVDQVEGDHVDSELIDTASEDKVTMQIDEIKYLNIIHDTSSYETDFLLKFNEIPASAQ